MPRYSDPIQEELSRIATEGHKAGTIRPGLTCSKNGSKPRLRLTTATRSAPFVKQLPYTWEMANTDPIRELMESVTRSLASGETLDDAVNAYLKPRESSETEFCWLAVYRSWLAKKNRSRESINKFDGWFGRFNSIIENPQQPVVNGKSVMVAYYREYLEDKSEPGSDMRARPLSMFSDIIEHAIEYHGLSIDWQVSKEFRLGLVGQTVIKEGRITPPVLTPQLKGLLEALKHSSPDTYCMVGLMAFYGLMGAELAVIRWHNDGMETFRQRKNHKLPKNRLAGPIEDVAFLSDQSVGRDIAIAWVEGRLSLPKSVQNAIDMCYLPPYSYLDPGYKRVGDAVRQVLDRNRHWQAIVEANLDITPYSLRHSFAWRYHAEWGGDVYECAKWMRHSIAIHNKTYSAFFTREALAKRKREALALAQEKARLASKNGAQSMDAEGNG